MKTVLLAGGLGSRLAEETVRIPKPMVEVGGQPIMLHVMDIYSHFGHRDFILACGYKALLIKRFFHDLYLMSNDFTVSLGDGGVSLEPCMAELAGVRRDAAGGGQRLPGHRGDWNVSVVDTGANTMTGGRIKRLSDWIGGETFMATYSDGVGNIDIDAVLDFHRSHGKLATVTAVQPPARFGNLELDGDAVTAFTEKVRRHETWINGGFFVFEPEVLDYIDGDDEPLERAPLTNLARDGQLQAYRHDGFWHPMDTVRDRDTLNELAETGTPPWFQFSPQGDPHTAAHRSRGGSAGQILQ